VRRYTGEGYETEAFAEADDFSEADGHSILTYHQAIERVGGELSELQSRARYTVADALDEWLADYRARARAPVSVTRQEAKVRRLKAELGSRVVDDLTTEAMTTWRNAIANGARRVRGKVAGESREVRTKPRNDAERAEIKRRRQATADRLWRSLTPALNLAWQNGKVRSADAWRRVKPFKGSNVARTRYLNTEEATKLLNSAAPDFRPLIHAALLTGCRWSEIRNLCVGDYNTLGNTLTIRNAKGKRDRSIPLTDEGAAFFEQHAAGRPTNALMFPKEEGQWGEADQLRRMAETCKTAGIPHIGFHGLRHTYGSLLAAASVPMAVIAEALGHADTRMTERHYAHLAPSYIATQIRTNLPTFSSAPAKVRGLRK